jgi:2-methylcitrate dehydratase PrpD
MSRWRRSSLRLGGAWVLTLLLLVPLALAGHHHGAEQSPANHSCATCTVAHAAFTRPPAPVVFAAVAIAPSSAALAPADVVAQLDQDDHHGRAPPSSAQRPR